MSQAEGLERNIKIEVPEEAVLRRLQVPPAKFEKSGPMAGLFEAALDRGYGLASASAVWKSLEVLDCTGKGVSFRDSGFYIRSSDVAKMLAPCARATLMAATIGGPLTIETRGLMAEKRMTEAMLLDAFGSEAVEAAIDRLCGGLDKAAMSEGLIRTRRFSPGYGDWSLSSQEAILDELKAERIGIRLNEQHILFPEKSITAVVGWHTID